MKTVKNNFIVENDFYKLELRAENGNIVSYKNKKSGKDYISHYGETEPLFTVRLMDENGARQDVRSDFACCVKVTESENCLEFCYSDVGIMKLQAKVRISFGGGAFVKWNLEVDNKSGMAVEWEQFPGMTLFNETAQVGGNYKIFLPLFEGVEIDDYSLRKKYFNCFSPDYPSKGWEGAYPGPVSLQFLSMYDGKEGFYIGMHDDTLQSKYIDFAQKWNGFKPSTKFLPGTDSELIEMPFETVTGFFEGGFYDAAEIYRDFALNSALKVQRKEFTEWLNEPPVVVIYPVRGEKDTGDVSPNCYYPYTNALPYLEKIKERIGERLLVMLCHWEGSAPWCPPFVWPPYGDAENFKEFFNKLHENGDLTGLYCSGISWTETSVYTDYSEKGRLSAQRLKETMCTAPDGGLPYAIICNEWLRNGYEMCPYTQSAKEIMKEAAGDMVRNGNADYIQMFDQNLGGNSSYCYSSEHGHPRTPGVWQTKAMRKMIKLLSSNNCVFGCESAAAEGFMDLLPFNDGRNYMGFCIGTPVPAYAYVYHEYINNFMGNQNTTMTYLDAAENPENLLYRLGHFFAQGEALCIVLKDGGKINWDWGTPWSQPDPEQEEVFALLRNLVDWRKGNLKEELIFGKMEKAFDINCEKYRIKRKDGRVIAYPSVITRAWSTKIMRSQIFVNPFPRENKVSFTEISGRLIKTPFGNAEDFSGDEFVLPPFSVYKLVF